MRIKARNFRKKYLKKLAKFVKLFIIEIYKNLGKMEGAMKNKCLTNKTFTIKFISISVINSIFAYIKKLRFTIEFLCPALRGPCLGFSFYVFR